MQQWPEQGLAVSTCSVLLIEFGIWRDGPGSGKQMERFSEQMERLARQMERAF